MSEKNYEGAASLFKIAERSPFARKKSIVQLAALARLRGNASLAESLDSQAGELNADPPWPDPLLDEVVSLQVGKRGMQRQIGRLEQRREFGEAAQLYLKQLEADPQSASAHVGAGINLARVRQFDRAITLLRRAIELEPKSSNAQYSLALAMFSHAERIAAEQPDAESAKGLFREVIDRARRAAELRPDNASAYLFWGLAHNHLHEPNQALEPLQRGIACAPADFELQLGLGEALATVGKTHDARAHLRNAQKLRPADPRPNQALRILDSAPSLPPSK